MPFGKAESENAGEAFFCQHGPAECSGNLMQSCVLHEINNQQDVAIRFVGCQMNKRSDFSGQVVSGIGRTFLCHLHS